MGTIITIASWFPGFKRQSIRRATGERQQRNCGKGEIYGISQNTRAPLEELGSLDDSRPAEQTIDPNGDPLALEASATAIWVSFVFI